MTEEKNTPHNDDSADLRRGDNNIWRGDDEAMTGALQIRLSRLCEEAGVAFDSSWTEAEGLAKLEELEARQDKNSPEDS